MKIVSYNIARAKFASIVQIADAIAELDADILLLQEVDRYVLRSGMVDQHRLIQKRGGFDSAYYFKAKKMNGLGSYGQALYLRGVGHSRPEIVELNSAQKEESRLAFYTHIRSENFDYMLAGAHLSSRSAEASEQLARLLNVLKFKSQNREKLVIAGDFNVRPTLIEKQGFTIDDPLPSCGIPTRNKRFDYILARGIEIDSTLISLPGLSDHDAVAAIIG